MAKWINANNEVPSHWQMVEIASFEADNNPPFWRLSHAWYLNDDQKWVRKGGEDWEIQFWRESEVSLIEEKPWKY